ncbi:MAG: ATP-binding protein, partial [Candidatus Heimdallarchaeota archaeon]|nr:ATP-binding protein [Candidatus Heimdallarchaeota archaeon]MCK5144785.1 ATP-binding protein [Candidatus Heimdallarchaeota archaeon]
MNDFKQLIASGESKTLEFKQTLPKSDVLTKSILAFSNMAGGKILIGIEDCTVETIGISDNEVLDMPDKISNIIHDCCTPNIIPEIYAQNIEGKNILVIEVFPGPHKPYYLKKKGRDKGTYIRVGATNKIADRNIIMDLDRQRRNISFDAEIDYDRDSTAIDFDKLNIDFKEYTNRTLYQKDL